MSLKIRTFSINTAKRSEERSRFFTIATVTGSCLGIYFIAWFTAVPEYFVPAATALGFQIGCWAFAWILLAFYFPGGYPRISDPAVLVLLWSGIYFIYPSILWLQGQVFAANAIIVDSAVFLFWLHGLFILGFILGHLCLRSSYSWSIPKLNINNLPSGWTLYLIPFILFLSMVLVRYLMSGNLLPSKGYGEAWSESHSNVLMSRSAGGFNYVITQITNKLWFYPLLIQGVGLGFIVIKMIYTRNNLLINIIIIVMIFLTILFLGSGGRSSVIMVYLIGLILSDMIIGPIPWRYLFSILLIGLLIFEFYGYVRGLSHFGAKQALTLSYRSFYDDSLRSGNIQEFSGMLLKESEGLKIFKTKEKEGIGYLIESVLQVCPSQLLPEKMHWNLTANILSKHFLGKHYDEGYGTAGAIIVDGYRLAGGVGIPLLGIIMGGILAVVHNRMINYSKSITKVGYLVSIALLSGFNSYLYNIIRFDVGSILTIIIYNVMIPWIIIRILFEKAIMVHNPKKSILISQREP